ncbi:hypothetical protein [Kitasatospora terrestris]|uniref:hypothetical protein n=1 Tax=Kitasatospora terrestris TaxID=258051 RepID=UPI0031EFA3C1
MAKKTKTFEFPEHLRAAQLALEEARAVHRAYREGLPVWDRTSEQVEDGWSEEQRAEEARLREAERVAAHLVWAHDFWKTVEVGDVVDARTALMHLEPVA